MPLGKITLTVQFSTPDNFRKEPVNFLVANFDNAYHSILGRSALAKFMAIPHYAYLVPKVPAKNDVISLRANLAMAYACETETLALAEALDLSIKMEAFIADSKKTPA